MNSIQKKLRLLQQLSGKTQAQLARDSGVTTLAFNNWWNGKSQPRIGAMKKIDALLATYGITTPPSDTTESAKKAVVRELSAHHAHILKKITARTDIIDHLSLLITYNTNAIEGSTLTLADTSAVIFDKRTLGNKTLIEQLEAKNHDNAFRFLLTHIQQKQKITESLALELHRKLIAGIRDDAGQYRTHPVRIVGSYVPTANHLKIPQLMNDLFARKHSSDIVAFVSKFHADFEKIHPFADGNGRVGRLLLIGLLLAHDFAPSIITKKDRPRYYKALQSAQLREDHEPLEELISDSIMLGYRIIND